MTDRRRTTIRMVRRRTPEEITALARDTVVNKCMVTDDPDTMRSAFMMVHLLPPFTKAAREAVGAFIGYYSDTIPGRAMDGYPIFTAMGFLHRADVPLHTSELKRLRQALGFEDPPES